MRSYMEIGVEFSSLSLREKEDYLLNELSLDELKLFGEGITKIGSTIGWSGYIDYVYNKRLSEIRENKLNDLGI